MATYKEIHGVKVQYRDSDATAIEGDVWYNSSTGLLKMYASAASWASGGNLNTGRAYLGALGSQTAALCMGGNVDPKQQNESYDGSSWTEVADLNTAKANTTGTGTQTAGLNFAYSPNGVNTESWNGASWTEVANLNTGRHDLSGCGTQTATLCIGVSG